MVAGPTVQGSVLTNTSGAYAFSLIDARRFQRFLHKGLGTPVPGANLPTTIVR
jgi:hypothetical protein